MRATTGFLGSAFFLLLAGCSCEAGNGESCETRADCDDGLVCIDGKCEDEPIPDGGPGPDSGVDAGPVETIEDIPVDEEIALADLEGPVDVVVDAHGIPHIYATTVHDATLVEGFMFARDRFVQLELGRRQASGRLAELVGPLYPSVIDEDIYMRVIGLRREAQAAWDAVPADSVAQDALEGYAAGVNAWVARLREGDESLPGGVMLVLPLSAIEEWTPVDSLTMGQLQSYSLGFDGVQDAEWSAYYEALASTFTQGAVDPELAARDGAAHDLALFAPSIRVSTLEGRIDQELRDRRVPRLDRPRVAAETLARAASSDEIGERVARRWGRGDDFGSNNWIVGGQHTASGQPLMSNDTHLGLDNPPIFYQVHLNTARNGEAAETLNVAGDTFAGVPGIILGFNENVAWGATVAYYDSTDIYAEVLSPGAGEDPPTVLFDGDQVPIQIIHEEVGTGTGDDTVPIDIQWVPHHGPLAPIIEDGQLVPQTGGDALSIRWTGFDLLSDPDAQKLLDPFFAAVQATTVDDFDAAWDDFSSAPHNWVVADSAGNILYTTKSRVPVRDAAALTFDPTTGEGLAPCFVLPGDGVAEWTGFVARTDLPQVKNPERGWLSTANNDQTGQSFDGNPFDATPYLGWTWTENAFNRAFRIDQLLTDLAERGDITIPDLQTVQSEHRSMLGARIAPHLIAAMDRARAEAATPGTHPDLADAVAAAGDDWARIEGLADRLAAWTFEAEDGMEDEDAAQVDDSIATTVFNVAVVELLRRAIGDELDAAGLDPADSIRTLPVTPMRTLLAMIEHPDRLVAVQDGESILWDDLATAGVVETQDAILVSSLVAAFYDMTTDDAEVDGELADLLGDDEADWRWGKLHTIRLTFAAGPLLPSIPADDSAEFPNGFPRHGDNFSVDASSPGLDDFDFTYHSGPAIRTVVELLADGAHGESVIPGGQSSIPTSAHYADEMELWRHNETHRIPLDEPGVVSTRERRLHFAPN